MTAKEKTKLLVGGVIGLGILAYIWIAPLWLWLKVLFTILALYEAWTVANKDDEDTISEAVAYLAGISHLVPLLFGAVYGYCLGAGILTDPIVSGAIGGLLCHFFFSMKQKQTEAVVEAIRQEDKLGEDRRSDR